MKSIQLIGLFVGALLFSCQQKRAQEVYTLKLKGSESMHETFDALKSDFEKTQDTLRLEIEGGGSRTGMMSIAEQEADIGLSSFPFNLDSLLGEDHGIYEHVVAYDGIVIIHNEANPVVELTNEQIKDIFSGKVTDWSQIGGPEGRIAPIIRDANSGTQHFFQRYFNLDTVSPLAIVTDNNNEIIANVFDNRNAIGFIGYAYFSVSANEVAITSNENTVEFVHPSTKNLANGKYPLKRSLRMYFSDEDNPKVKAFLTYLGSERAKTIIEGYGLIAS